MRWILSLQPDFIAQKFRLQNEIEKRGYKCIFYPKFHCELNGKKGGNPNFGQNFFN